MGYRLIKSAEVGWQYSMTPPGKPPAYAGTDFIVARNGRIASVYLFFDNLPLSNSESPESSKHQGKLSLCAVQLQRLNAARGLVSMIRLCFNIMIASGVSPSTMTASTLNFSCLKLRRPG
jgi:hypothetical protein